MTWLRFLRRPVDRPLLDLSREQDIVFLDGSRVTPGTARCMCDSPEPRPDGKARDCEFPCWQRIGLTSAPCCPDCQTLPDPEAA